MSSHKVEICEVKAVKHHPNADRLDIIKVKGWDVIVGRDEYKVGDTGLYVPPDSMVPDDFVREFNLTYLKGKGANKRIGVVKLRNEWSEGLFVPNTMNAPVGTDLAKFYKITKWEPQSASYSSGKPRKDRRGRKLYGGLFKKYTDIENIKNFNDILEEGEPVVITEKIHGTNFRAGWVPVAGGKPKKLLLKLFGKTHEFVVGSHNVILDDDVSSPTYYGDNIYAFVASAWTLKERIPYDYVVYGEIFGTTTGGKVLQKGYSYGQTSLAVRFFDVMYKGEYLNWKDAVALLISWGLQPVYTLYRGPWNPELINKYAIDMSVYDENTLREGIVIRPAEEREHKRLGRVILKAISPAYLQQQGRTEGH